MYIAFLLYLTSKIIANWCPYSFVVEVKSQKMFAMWVVRGDPRHCTTCGHHNHRHRWSQWQGELLLQIFILFHYWLYILKLKDLRYILKKTPLTSNLKSNGSMVAVFVVPKIHQKQEIVHRAGHEHYQMIIQDMRQLDIGYCINNIGGELRRSWSKSQSSEWGWCMWRNKTLWTCQEQISTHFLNSKSSSKYKINKEVRRNTSCLIILIFQHSF